MLERIETVQGVGLFHDANGKRFKWEKATLIYADNGRGKSTLTTLLRSAGTGDPKLVSDRATIDGTLTPKSTLQFSNGHRVTFAAKGWSEARPELQIFDADFVENNVHSGGVVKSEHRKSLLQFAIGEKAVRARHDEESATEEAKKASGEVLRITDQLSGFHPGIDLASFETIDHVADADEQAQQLEKRLTAANNIATILRRAVPTSIPIPRLDIEGLFSLLRTTLEDVQEDAEANVRSHIDSLGSHRAEAWLSQGQEFTVGDLCPYCQQSIAGLDLIKAYKTFFNAKYAEMKANLSAVAASIFSGTDSSVITNFKQGVAAAMSAAGAWAEQVTIPSIAFSDNVADHNRNELHTLLRCLVTRKQMNPTISVGTNDELEISKSLWLEIIAQMTSVNEQIETARREIIEFRQKLQADDIQEVTKQLNSLDLARKRHSADVKLLFEKLADARRVQKVAEKKKKDARLKLEGLMKATLDEYQGAINNLLVKFGAAFRIEKLDVNFRGGSPRSDYGLALRGKSVPLDGGPPSFSTTLSDGDKRTLAFAFFVASTLADGKLADRIVVIDDPMCSLDLNRKQHTRIVLKEICNRANQLIVLAHDVHFLRSLRNDLMSKTSTFRVAVLSLRHAADGYTDFADLDLDKECQSPYYNNYHVLSQFSEFGAGDVRNVAKSIRPLLEGYLHRRFPGLIPAGLMFGQVVTLITDAELTSPLCCAKGAVAELNEINQYAGQFHHDTNPGYADTVPVVASELHAFARRALNIIHKGSP